MAMKQSPQAIAAAALQQRSSMAKPQSSTCSHLWPL
jgi:hypothetical protein